jgi:hypothetical protein
MITQYLILILFVMVLLFFSLGYFIGLNKGMKRKEK